MKLTKATHAYLLRVAGLTWSQIAEAVGLGGRVPRRTAIHVARSASGAWPWPPRPIHHAVGLGVACAPEEELPNATTRLERVTCPECLNVHSELMLHGSQGAPATNHHRRREIPPVPAGGGAL